MISITYIILTRLYFVHSLRRKFPSSLNPTNLNFSFILLIITLFSMSSIKIAINKYKVKFTQFNYTHNIFTQVGSLSVSFFFYTSSYLWWLVPWGQKKSGKYITYPFHYRMAFAFYVILLPLIDNLLYSKSCLGAAAPLRWP